MLLFLIFFSCQKGYEPLSKIPDLDGEGRGGMITGGMFSFPKSFNAYLDNYSIISSIFSLIYESFCDFDSDTGEWKPLLAKKWTVSKDKRIFTFHLNPKATFNDGTPVTTEDVLFTYKVLMNTNHLTILSRISLSKFHFPEVIDKWTIRFRSKDIHWRNFINLCSLRILPKHLYEGKDFNKDFNTDLPIGSGPYSFDKIKLGYSFTLKREKNWWAKSHPHYKNKFNFDFIRFKTYGGQLSIFEALKKGEIQALQMNVSRLWVNETLSKKFKKNYIVKQKIYNHRSQSVQGMHFNLRKKIFSEKKVRLAMAHLFNREKMNETLMFSQYKMLASYYPTYFENKRKKKIDFSLEKASKLLKEAHWTGVNEEGILTNTIDNQIKKFELDIFYYDKGFEKFYTIFKEDCRKVGIAINLHFVSWSRFSEMMEKYQFDLINLNRSSSYFFDPEASWHSKYVSVPNGNNISGYQNKQVDRLIEQMKKEFDFKKRLELLNEINQQLINDVPVILGWGLDYVRLVYWNIFETPKDVLSKIGSSTMLDVISNWKYSREKWTLLLKAKEESLELEKPAYEIFIDPITF